MIVGLLRVVACRCPLLALILHKGDDGTATLMLDFEGLFRNANAAADMRLLQWMVTVLGDFARHVYVAHGSLMRPDEEALAALAALQDTERRNPAWCGRACCRAGSRRRCRAPGTARWSACCCRRPVRRSRSLW
jgi:hypothetical protein